MTQSDSVSRASPRPATGPPPPDRLPRNVWALGVVSLFTDISSEMLVPILPLFVTSVLRASVASLGVIEGVGESVAALLRIGSGWLSDRSGERKPLLLFGYSLSTVSKVAMGFATVWPMVLLTRFSDRVGKGLRNPPRDAMIADSVEPALRGRAFGLHRTLDTLGAAIGPMVAFGLLALWPGDFRRIFVLSAIPGVLSVVVLIALVRSAKRPPRDARSLAGDVRALGAPFKRFLVANGVFQLANSSMAFVLLRVSQAGFRDREVPLVYVGFNLAYAALSYPAGLLGDRVGRRRLLLASYLLYVVIYALLAWRAVPVVVVGALLLLGLHSALLEVSQRSLVADLTGEQARGTAYGIYYTVTGLALLPASIVAGVLWDRFGARVMFAADAALALLAALLFAVLLPAHRELRERHADSR